MPSQKKNVSRPTRSGDTSDGGSGRAVRRRDSEVIGAATQLFYERGYAETSVQDVAEALGMLKGSLYYYIDTKEDLLFRLLEQVHQGYDVHMSQWQARIDLPALERLTGYVTSVVQDNMANLAKMSVYYHDMDRLSPERHAVILRGRRAHVDFVVGLISEAQASGDANASADARLLANFVFGSMIWIYRWYRPGGEFRRDEIASACVGFILGGVTSHTGSVPS
jgi:TetR/AcrR family transcriptional regulator, cholesterol catabolism regulator